MKDPLEAGGIVLPTVTPASVIRAAYAAKIIEDGDGWMRALDVRNKMAHIYSAAAFESAVGEIKSSFLALMDALHETVLARAIEATADDPT